MVEKKLIRKKKTKEELDRLIVPPGRKISLAKDHDPGFTGKLVEKRDAAEMLQRGVRRLAELQDMLYAQDRHALLVVFQAMDAAGKDGTIKHVMSGVNPQGVQVYGFKAPSPEEMDHDYLWRSMKALPERGRIGIFNRSYYEEVLVVRVHPEILAAQRLPEDRKGNGIWKRRFQEINHFEKYLDDNGVHVLKFFLNVSREEQKRRFLERIEEPGKNWKFSAADVRERGEVRSGRARGGRGDADRAGHAEVAGRLERKDPLRPRRPSRHAALVDGRRARGGLARDGRAVWEDDSQREPGSLQPEVPGPICG